VVTNGMISIHAMSAMPNSARCGALELRDLLIRLWAWGPLAGFGVPASLGSQSLSLSGGNSFGPPTKELVISGKQTVGKQTKQTDKRQTDKRKRLVETQLRPEPSHQLVHNPLLNGGYLQPIWDCLPTGL